MNGLAWLQATFHYHWGWWECTGRNEVLVHDPVTREWVTKHEECISCPDAREAVAAELKDWRPGK